MEQIELLTVEQLCQLLQIGKNTAYKLIQTGKIKGFRVGRSWKIPRDSVVEYIKKQGKWRLKNKLLQSQQTKLIADADKDKNYQAELKLEQELAT